MKTSDVSLIPPTLYANKIWTNNARIVNAVHIDPYSAQEGGPNCPIRQFYRTHSDHCIALSIPESVRPCSWWILIKFDLSKLLKTWISLICCIHGFVKINTWISLSCFMDLSKLPHEFVKVFLWISCPLPNKTKLKFDQDFKASWRCWMNQSTHCLWNHYFSYTLWRICCSNLIVMKSLFWAASNPFYAYEATEVPTRSFWGFRLKIAFSIKELARLLFISANAYFRPSVISDVKGFCYF